MNLRTALLGELRREVELYEARIRKDPSDHLAAASLVAARRNLVEADRAVAPLLRRDGYRTASGDVVESFRELLDGTRAERELFGSTPVSSQARPAPTLADFFGAEEAVSADPPDSEAGEEPDALTQLFG